MLLSAASAATSAGGEFGGGEITNDDDGGSGGSGGDDDEDELFERPPTGVLDLTILWACLLADLRVARVEALIPPPLFDCEVEEDDGSLRRFSISALSLGSIAKAGSGIFVSLRERLDGKLSTLDDGFIFESARAALEYPRRSFVPVAVEIDCALISSAAVSNDADVSESSIVRVLTSS